MVQRVAKNYAQEGSHYSMMEHLHGVLIGFYREVFQRISNLLILRSFITMESIKIEDGNHYLITKTVQQVAWISCLILMVIKAIRIKKDVMRKMISIVLPSIFVRD